MLKNELKHIEKFLRGQDKNLIISDLMKFCRENSELRAYLLDRAKLKPGDKKGLLDSLRRELSRVAKKVGRYDSWTGEMYFPDYSKVRKGMNALLEAGQADDLLSIGPDFFRLAVAQIEQSDDEGETCDDIGLCVPMFVEALRRSPRAELEKMIWAMEAVQDSDFNLADELECYLKEKHPPSAWSNFADQMSEKLAEMPVVKNSYRREQLSDWVTYALEQAGRESEIQAFYENEAKRTRSYGRLIKHLLKEGRLEDADRWIREGKKGEPANSHELRRYLQELRKLQKDWPSLSLLDVEFFVECPCLKHFDECRTTAKKTGVWPKLRQTLLDYLAQGQAPWQHPDWPWTGLSGEMRGGQQRHPMVEYLVEIAIHENRPEECLFWFDKLPPKDSFLSSQLQQSVARCVKKYAPERAVSIWKLLAENDIAHVSPSSYLKAGEYLQQARLVMNEQGITVLSRKLTLKSSTPALVWVNVLTSSSGRRTKNHGKPNTAESSAWIENAPVP